ncbi:MAG: YfhO family protein [Oscillospiraceae bacterium]
MLQNKDKFDRRYLLAFALGFLVSGLFMGLSALFTDGYYYVGGDFVYQQLEFCEYMNNAIKSGNVFFAGAVDLGTNFVGAFSFYNLASPFFLLSLLASGKSYYLLCGIFIALKFAAAGVCSYAWLKRSVVNPDNALIGAMLYTFSAYQIGNTFYPFADAVAFFPLLLLTLDFVMEDKHEWAFPAVISLSLFTNFIFFVSEVVFCLLYFIVKLIGKDYVLTVKRFFKLAGLSVLGLLLSGIITLPSVLFTFGNPRLSEGFGSVWRMLALKPVYFADMFRSMIFTSEFLPCRAMLVSNNSVEAELFLPLFGIIATAAYMLSKKRDWVTKLLCVSLVFAFVPILNSAFVMFNSEYYTRWFYMPILIMTLAAVRVLEDREIKIKRGLAAFFGLCAVFIGCLLAFKYYYSVETIYDWGKTLYLCLMTGISVLFCMSLRKIQKSKNATAIIMCGVIAFSLVTGFVNNYVIKEHLSTDFKGYDHEDLYAKSRQLELPNSEQYYRIDTLNTYVNLGLILNRSSVNSFISTVNGSVFEFYEEGLLRTRTIRSNLEHDRYAVRALLSTRYYIGSDNLEKPDDYKFATYVENQGNYAIWENDFFIPMGFTYDSSSSTEDLAGIKGKDRDFVFLTSLVLSPESQKEYEDILPAAPSGYLCNLTHARFEEDVEARRRETCQRFEETKDGYSAGIELAKDNLVFFSIPYDTGWTVTVNGVNTKIVKANYGFMAIPCKAGANEIEFHYMPPGLKVGAAASTVGALGLAATVFFAVKKKRKASRETPCI